MEDKKRAKKPKGDSSIGVKQQFEQMDEAKEFEKLMDSLVESFPEGLRPIVKNAL